MTSGKIGYFGLSAAVALAIAAVVTAYVPPGVAVSTPGHATPVAESRSDPAPQRFDLTPAAGESAATVSGLPGGASSLNETYEDWRIACARQGNRKRCVLSQVQTQQNGQRVLAIELNAQSRCASAPAYRQVASSISASRPRRWRRCVPARP